MWLEQFHKECPAIAVETAKSWAQLTTLGIGAAKPVVIRIANETELADTLHFLNAHQIPVFVLGGGSNLVGTDEPIDCAVIRLKNEFFSGVSALPNGNVLIEANLRMPHAAQEVARYGFGGLAPLAGIPGTIGGLLRMNAGANGISIGDFVVQLRGMRFDGSEYTASGADIQWNYRTTSIPDDVILLEAELKLPESEPQSELEAIAADVSERRLKEPRGRNAGCIFRNPGLDESAGKLIDELGLKGYRVGGVSVSCEHANYLVNDGTASVADFVELVRHIGQKVFEATNLVLQPEVRFVDDAVRRAACSYQPACKVALFLGGSSSEREISLRSGAAVSTALRRAGYEVIEHDIHACELPAWLNEEMVVFPVLHGGFGEDGSLQKLLEAAHLRFVGSGSAACKLVMDKIATKKLLDAHQIPTAKWATVTREHPDFPPELHFPVVMKAPNEGSTIGIAKVSCATDYPTALDELLKLAPEILIEEFIVGKEISIPVVGGRVLPVIEIQSPHGFYDYDAKYVYNQGHTQYFCPPVSIPPEQQELAQKYSLEFFVQSNCRDLLRVDFIIDEDGIPQMLEGNALPGFTATSLVPKAARVTGISFERLCAGLVMAAANRKA